MVNRILLYPGIIMLILVDEEAMIIRQRSRFMSAANLASSNLLIAFTKQYCFCYRGNENMNMICNLDSDSINMNVKIGKILPSTFQIE